MLEVNSRIGNISLFTKRNKPTNMLEVVPAAHPTRRLTDRPTVQNTLRKYSYFVTYVNTNNSWMWKRDGESWNVSCHTALCATVLPQSVGQCPKIKRVCVCLEACITVARL
jgi:hypothetical protein